jgi:hypothetical protein
MLKRGPSAVLNPGRGFNFDVCAQRKIRRLGRRLSALALHQTTYASARCDCRLFSGATPNFQQNRVTGWGVGERNRDDPLAASHSEPDGVFDTSVDHGASRLFLLGRLSSHRNALSRSVLARSASRPALYSVMASEASVARS